jgi:hypothetical protein
VCNSCEAASGFPLIAAGWMFDHRSTLESAITDLERLAGGAPAI